MITPPIMSFSKDTYCGSCGTKFAEQQLYPRRCFHCGNDTYRNPIPVVVPIVPVPYPGFSIYNRKHPTQWLIQRRNIDPQKGGWSLPSGYVNYAETWQQAVVRELQEEMGLLTKPEDFEVLEVVNATNNNMLIFCFHKDGVKEEDIHFTSNEEVSEIQLITNPYKIELCFPSHNEQLRKFYDSLDW